METTLKQFRKALGLSQEEVGRRVGVTGVAISRIESGDRALTDRMALALCKEFNVDYGWLTTGQGEMFVNTDDAQPGGARHSPRDRGSVGPRRPGNAAEILWLYGELREGQAHKLRIHRHDRRPPPITGSGNVKVYKRKGRL